MRGSWRPQLLLVVLCALLLFTNLGQTSLWDIDEPRNAGCAAEMFEQGELVVPTFNGELRSHKPVMLYWLMMSAYQVLGVNELAARFWSALLAMGTVLVTYHLGCRLFGRSIGLWAGVILATSLNFVVIGRAATPDATFLFFTTLALAVFAMAALPRGELHAADDPKCNEERSFQSERRPITWALLACVYFLLALAVLTKGPVGVVLPTCILVLWTLCRRTLPAGVGVSRTNAVPVSSGPLWRRFWGRLSPQRVWSACWSLRPLTALAVICIVALPWYVAVGLRTQGEWIAQFLGQHNLGRFLTPMENHRGPLFYYLIAVTIGFLPWSLLIGLTLWQQIQRLRKGYPWHDAYVFLACWIGVFFVFFSLATTKLPHYMIPIYPALALLTAAAVDSLVRGESPALVRWLPATAILLMLLGVGFLVGLPIAARMYLPGEGSLGLVGFLPLAGGVTFLVLLQRKQVAGGLYAFATTAVLLLAVLFGFLQQRIDHHQHSIEIVETIRQAGGDDAQVAGFCYLRPSWVFYYRRPIADFTKLAEVRAFFDNSPNAFLIVQDHDMARLAASLPPDVRSIASVPKFLKRGQVLILGRAAAAERLAASRKGKVDEGLTQRR